MNFFFEVFLSFGTNKKLCAQKHCTFICQVKVNDVYFAYEVIIEKS